MDLKSYLAVLWRRKLVILVAIIMTVAVTMAGSYVAEPIYAASTTIRVATASSGSSDWATYDVVYTDRLMNTYRTIVTSDRSAEEVRQRLGLAETPSISVDIPANTELMQITVEHDDPEIAARAANEVAMMLIEQRQERSADVGQTAQEILRPQLTQLETEIAEARTEYDALLAEAAADDPRVVGARESLEIREQTYFTLLDQYERLQAGEGSNEITVVQEAVPPSEPSSLPAPLMLALALLVGSAGGVGLAFLFENFDTTLYSNDQIQYLTGLPLLGRIPTTRKRDRFAVLGPDGNQQEAFRRLRTNLLALDFDAPLRTVLVTSSEPSEGKTTVTTNMAIAIAQSGRSVVVVDADLRRPSVHTMFNVRNDVGLINVLGQGLTVDEAVRTTKVPGVSVLTSGPLTRDVVDRHGLPQVSPNPVELLGLPQMTELMSKLERLYDVILIDSPSLQSGADAAVLATNVDGVLLVVARGQARKERVAAALQQLSSVRARALGVIVNRANLPEPYPQYQQEANWGSQGNIPPNGNGHRRPPVRSQSIDRGPVTSAMHRSAGPDAGPSVTNRVQHIDPVARPADGRRQS